jgi:hypothetical protein
VCESDLHAALLEDVTVDRRSAVDGLSDHAPRIAQFTASL